VYTQHDVEEMMTQPRAGTFICRVP